MIRKPDIENEVRKRGITALPAWTSIEPLIKYWQEAEKTPYPQDSRDAFTVTFEGGFRRAEAITIRKDQCQYNEEGIIIRKAPVLKKKRRQLDMIRDVIIKRDKKDPFSEELVNLINRSKNYLLPGYKPFTHNKNQLRHLSPRSLYNRINEISPDLFPHALRSYRASFLVYERGFELRDLVDWFKWDSQGGIQMALHYTSQVDMAKKLGIKNIPKSSNEGVD
jgi:integrase